MRSAANTLLSLLSISVLALPFSSPKPFLYEVEEFHLEHNIPAGEALTALRSGDKTLQLALFSKPKISSDVRQGLQPLRLAFQSRDQFIFDWSQDARMEEAGEMAAFYDRLPASLPAPQDHGTVLSFARMAANSYVNRTESGSESPDSEWRNNTGWEAGDDFGWEGTGLRGHVFLNARHTIAVISFKGTSTILHGGETVARDKYMDNIMFSCCCARVDLSWTPVCGCYAGGLAGGRSSCNLTCLEGTVRDDSQSYFQEALAVTQLVLVRYPRATLWFTGHSLGGAIAALMAVRVRRTAALTFSSPGPLLYARRLGLHGEEPDGSQWKYPVWNYGLASDPIFTGTCTGLATSCYLSGYAMETACRHGMDCKYAVSSWQPDVATHRIDWMIDHVLERPEKYPLPLCLPNRNCTDCQKWAYL